MRIFYKKFKRVDINSHMYHLCTQVGIKGVRRQNRETRGKSIFQEDKFRVVVRRYLIYFLYSSVILLSIIHLLFLYIHK